MIEIVAEGVPTGLGAPIYGKLDADLAGALMSINAVKGVEIGEGFAAAALSGEANADESECTNGWRSSTERRRRHSWRHLDRPTRCRALRRKPTSSILSPRHSVDRSGHDVEISTKGRHDPCVGIRAVPVGEAMMACVLADHLLRNRAQNPNAPTNTRLPRN